MAEPISEELKRALAITDREQRVAALRALLPSLTSDDRVIALINIEAALALERLLQMRFSTAMALHGNIRSEEVPGVVAESRTRSAEDPPGDPTRSFTLPTAAAIEAIVVDRPVVSLGFAELVQPQRPLPATRTLVAGQAYYLWIEIGAPVEDAVNAPAPLPIELLPQEITLDVIVFASPEGFAVSQDGGQIRIAGKQIAVTRAVATPAVDAALLERRLFFAVTAPARPGEYRLACHLYYQGTLIQSHEVIAEVAETATPRPRRPITARMDYVLSEKLTPRSLAGYGAHTLSVAAGSHGFAFRSAAGEFARDASFDGQEVQDLIDRARRAFRAVSWGNDGAWQRGMAYRYDAPAGVMQLTADLARLAIAGYRNYDAIVARLGGDADALAAQMRAPGVIQLALKQSARLVLPLALIYDHRLDADGDLDRYTLCEQFVRSTGALEDHPCFLGNCPHREEGGLVVCPSGFWGFRHEIGVPPTLAEGDGTPTQLPALLACPGAPSMTVAVSMDPEMHERDVHVRQLGALLEPLQIQIAETRADALRLLRDGAAHLVYFYCHGGVDDNAPYLQIGAPRERISRSTLRNERIHWSSPRSLVFINGCHTTDLEPERAIELVTGFVQTAGGSGVIGTEITVFEPLATRFAEACIAALLARETVGRAVRRARLALLEDWNPLGLLYVPFAMASLRLAPPS